MNVANYWLPMCIIHFVFCFYAYSCFILYTLNAHNLMVCYPYTLCHNCLIQATQHAHCFSRSPAGWAEEDT